MINDDLIMIACKQVTGKNKTRAIGDLNEWELRWFAQHGETLEIRNICREVLQYLKKETNEKR